MIRRLWGICLVFFCVAASTDAALLFSEWQFGTAQAGPLVNYAATTRDSGVSAAVLSSSGGTIVPSVTGGVLQYSWGNGGEGGLNGAVLHLEMTVSSAYSGPFSASYSATSAKLTALTGTWSYWVNSGTPTLLSPKAINLAGANNDALANITLSPTDVLHLQFAFSGAVASSGNGDLIIDNLNISVPEPVNVALGIFGVLAMAMACGRRVLAVRRA